MRNSTVVLVLRAESEMPDSPYMRDLSEKGRFSTSPRHRAMQIGSNYNILATHLEWQVVSKVRCRNDNRATYFELCGLIYIGGRRPWLVRMRRKLSGLFVGRSWSPVGMVEVS